jgi:hypothetical protein
MKSTGRFTAALKKLTHYCHDHCSRCGSPLPKGVPAYAGYTDDGDEVYVGECCKTSITELASHIYWWWTTYKRPSPGTVLWRYMDFAKFAALLKDRALHFSRADHLGDAFEGARGLLSRQAEWKDYCKGYFREAILTAPGAESPMSSEKVEAEAERLYSDFQALGEREVRNTYVSCWHANELESEALWRLYTPPSTAGIALRTEFDALNAALCSNFEIKFGHVQYVDFATGFAGTYDRIFWKRASLKHEAEVRGVISRMPWEESEEPGLLVPINLDRGIQSVVTSPFAPAWFGSLVEATIRKFGAKLRVQSSELSAEPFY